MGSRPTESRRSEAVATVTDERQAETPDPPGEPRSLLPTEVSPLIAQAQQAFRRDLPSLLLASKGRWVAYRGEQRIGIGDYMMGLYRECFAKGIKPDELVVRLVDSEQLNDELEIDLTDDV